MHGHVLRIFCTNDLLDPVVPTIDNGDIVVIEVFERTEVIMSVPEQAYTDKI